MRLKSFCRIIRFADIANRPIAGIVQSVDVGLIAQSSPGSRLGDGVATADLPAVACFFGTEIERTVIVNRWPILSARAYSFFTSLANSS